MNVLGSVFLGDAQRHRVLSSPTPPMSPHSSSPHAQTFSTSTIHQNPSGSSIKAPGPLVDTDLTSVHPSSIDSKLSLELRIRWLEVLLLGVKHDNWGNDALLDAKDRKPTSAQGKAENAPLVNKVEELQKRMDTIVAGNDGLRKFIDRYDQHENILNPSFALSGSTAPPTYSSMSSEELDALLAEMEPEVRAADRDLREIDLLDKRGVLGAGNLAEHVTLRPRLEALQKAHAEDLETARDLERRISNVLRRYASRVDALSELFVEWNDALTLAEDKITALERERSEKQRLGLE